MSNWEYWCWYKAQVVHQSFSLPLCILCFTPRWQEWLALSQTCVLEVQECPVHAPFRLLKRTWRLINTCNLHTRPCVQVRLLKSCQAHTRSKNWGKGGTLIKAPQTWNYFFLPEHFITWAVLSGPHVSLNCKIVFFLLSAGEQLCLSTPAYNVYLESLHLILDLLSHSTKRWEYCTGRFSFRQ